jgi:adenine-specific DNA-methyltransferase
MVLSICPDLFDAAARDEKPRKSRSAKAELGQFFTPPGIAAFMASAFPQPTGPVALLDAGAGEGALTEAFVKRWSDHVPISARLYELDERVLPVLEERAKSLTKGHVSVWVECEDFLEAAAMMLMLSRGDRFTHAILNPPYRKIGTASRARGLISSAGLETVNLYTGFVGLALELLRPGGQLVAIIPRSFCNGPYYRPFRRFITARAALCSIHLFGSRRDAFAGDEVLQENVIIRLERGGAQGDVLISTSTNAGFEDLDSRVWKFDEIIVPGDDELFIHVPTTENAPLAEEQAVTTSLADLGLQVSTGPVVDFRLRRHLRGMPENGTVPLIYPQHLKGPWVVWPVEGGKKPNAIARNRETERWLFPTGWYAAVRRFSSKEERRRVVATVIDPRLLDGDALGLENHINVFHSKRRPLSPELAAGLTLYLNTSAVDAAFRRFNGHTQVNATDLRQLSYPTRIELEEIGRQGGVHWPTDQQEVDKLVAGVITSAS